MTGGLLIIPYQQHGPSILLMKVSAEDRLPTKSAHLASLNASLLTEAVEND